MNLMLAIRTFFALVPFLTWTAASAQSSQPLPTPRSTQSASAYGKIPLQFEENRGQADAAAKFLSRGPGYSILLQPDAATILLHRSKQPDLHHLTPVSSANGTEVVRMQLAGADAKAAMTAQQPLQGYVNYMTGPYRKDWKLGVPTFAQTRVSGAYPGIDVVYYGTQRQMEYDFVVAPHADASLIRLSITGARPVVAKDGALMLQAQSGRALDDLQFRKPVLYQQVEGKRSSVEGSFVVAANGTVGFHIGGYDHSRELIIDPIISYASYFGGSGEDEINASALNASNQLYAVGQTFSASLPGTAGEFQTGSAANNNGHDAFVTKFSADGSSILWTTYLSGAGDDFATGVAVNGSDQPYIVGYTASCGDGGLSYATAGEFPFVGGVQPLCNPSVRGFNNFESNGAGYDAFLVKLSSDGKTELYGTPLGGSYNDIASSVALDATGKVYIVGETFSTMYTYSSDLSRAADVPSYPVNNHGNAAIGTSNYPTTTTAFYTNTTESKNNAVTCSSALGNCPGLPPGSVSGPQDEQAFLTVLSPDLGTIVYSSLLGGPVLGNAGNGTSATNGIAVAVNANGIAYIGGNTSSAHWPVSAGALVTACGNGGTVSSTCYLTGWLAAFDATKSGSASLLFNTYLNGQTAGTSINGTTNYPGSDVFGLTTDSTGNAIVTGDTNATDFPTTAGTLQPACSKFNDGNGNTNVCEFEGYVAKVSPAGALLWSTYVGPTPGDIATTAGRGVAVDSSNNVYVLASTGSNTLPTKNAIATSTAGNLDYYVAELNPTGTTLLMGTYMGIGGGFAPNNNSLAIDSNATVYISGSQAPNNYGGTYFPVTANAADKTIQGSDGFVVKLITQQQPSATALTVSPTGTATPSQTVTLTATVTTPSTITGTLLPTGVVTFYNNTSVAIGTATLNTSGVATYTGTLAAGAYNITASYPGDTGFSASVSTATALTVSSSSTTTTTLTVAPATSTYGTAEVLTATVKSGATAATSGTVTFAAGNVTFGTATVNASGIATLSVTPAAGIYTVIASYAGTYNGTTNPTGYGASASSSMALTVTKATSTTALTSSAAQVGPGVSFTLTATVPAAATGSVTFYSGTTALGAGNVSNGVATLSTSIAAAGTYSLTAAYGGDTNFSGSTSAALTQTVAVPTFTVSASPSSLTIVRGSSGTTTLTLTPAGGFTGTVTLSCGSLPSKATCAFNPTTVTLGTSAVTDVLTVGTGSLSASMAAPHLFGDRRGEIYSAGLLGLPASMLALFGLARRRKLTAPALRASLLAAMCLLAVGALSGCGGSSSTTTASNATPAGTYAVSVTLTSGTTTQTVPLTIVVQ